MKRPLFPQLQSKVDACRPIHHVEVFSIYSESFGAHQDLGG